MNLARKALVLLQRAKNKVVSGVLLSVLLEAPGQTDVPRESGSKVPRAQWVRGWDS